MSWKELLYHARAVQLFKWWCRSLRQIYYFVFMFQIIENYKSALSESSDNISVRAVIHNIRLKGWSPQEVCEDMVATRREADEEIIADVDVQIHFLKVTNYLSCCILILEHCAKFIFFMSCQFEWPVQFTFNSWQHLGALPQTVNLSTKPLDVRIATLKTEINNWQTLMPNFTRKFSSLRKLYTKLQWRLSWRQKKSVSKQDSSSLNLSSSLSVLNHCSWSSKGLQVFIPSTSN